MSQPGKVLHLYVEVRASPDQSAGKEGVAQGRPGQDGPAELLSQLVSQTAVAKTTSARRLVQDRSRSPSASGLRRQKAGGSPAVAKRRSAPRDGPSAVHSPPTRPSSGKVSVPHTPPCCRQGGEEAVGDGKRSVVTFSYVEKANVKSLDSPRSSLCERGTREERSTPTHYRKRLSDPVWFGSPGSSCSSSPKLTFRSPGSRRQTPGVRHPSLDPIGRAASQRAVEEFGSPLLRIKLAHALEQASSSRYNQQLRCQSWAGSPVQRQNTSVNLRDHFPDRSQAVCGLPRSPASDRLSSQSRLEAQSPLLWPTEDRAAAGSPAVKRHVQRSSTSPQGALLTLGNNGVEGLNQLSDSKASSPAQSPDVTRRPAEEATEGSSIFTEARRSSLHNALGAPPGECHNPAPNAQQSQQTLKMNIPLNNQHTPAAADTDSQRPGSSIGTSHQTNSHASPRTHQEDCAQKCQRQSSTGSHGIPSRVFRPSHPPTELSSPMRDPRLFQAELRAPDTPTLHRRQLPQYARDSWCPSPDTRGELSGSERGDCTELARRLFINQSVGEAPVSWTSRQQWGSRPENGPSPEDETPNGHPAPRRRPLSPTAAQQKRAEQRRREILLLGPVALDSPEEDEGCEEEGGRGDETEAERERAEEEPAEQNGAMRGSSSRSSSGVTGSLGDMDCVSPESSQSSHQSNETGAATSGIQTDSGCAAPVPSLHCQRIARAKWEFLFGTPDEEAASRREKSESTSSSISAGWDGGSPPGGPERRGGAEEEGGEEVEAVEEEEEEEEEEEMVSWASVRMQGDNRKQEHAAREEPQVFGHLLKR
ncbi:hypothetical protein EYF80_043680 [Liparis tanakae]|uniref:Uncharacterized protein n=1 Tax=Liparis tanakae TaxID=230148 RepID=A0A4Z2FZZ4_9TELE|nr:hypothetical protein EYF80_043680 [Liparis tanakae]